MKKYSVKLILAVAALFTAGVLAVSVSFAWMVLSESPVVNGITVALSGGRTILLAPDLSETAIDADGKSYTVHYPGTFSETMRLNGDEYAYLSTLGALGPVSTADGKYFMTEKSGAEAGASLTERFAVDDSLAFANTAEDGGYLYFDLWVVSPGSDYELRIATDSHTHKGSYLIELPRAEQTESGAYTLSYSDGTVAAIARVGFLVNEDGADSASVNAYAESDAYDARYRTLLGKYSEKGQKQSLTQTTNFVIYEPNGILHPSGKINGYTVTQPLCYDPFLQTISSADVSEYLAVQTVTSWKNTPPFSEIFTAAIAGRAFSDALSAQEYFYGSYLQNGFDSYLETGLFFKDTSALYHSTAEQMQSLAQAGAADHAVITTLRRNVPQRIRVFVWLEGQDGDCAAAGAVEASQIALRLEFAGA